MAGTAARSDKSPSISSMRWPSVEMNCPRDVDADDRFGSSCRQLECLRAAAAADIKDVRAGDIAKQGEFGRPFEQAV
jgi:hypothetical protein